MSYADSIANMSNFGERFPLAHQAVVRDTIPPQQLQQIREELERQTGVISLYPGKILTFPANIRCAYCGTTRKDEDSCRNCGAPRERS